MNAAKALVLVAAILLMAAPHQAWSAPTCGTSITTDTALGEDVSCIGNGFTVDEGVTLDCQGHTITGNGGGTGVTLSAGARLTNCFVRWFSEGVHLSSNDTVTGTTAGEASMRLGFTVAGDYNYLAGDTADRTAEFGFYISGSHNTLVGNTAVGNLSYDRTAATYYGFYVDGYQGMGGNRSVSNTFTGNAATGNDYGFYVWRISGSVLQGNDAHANSMDGFDLVEAVYTNVTSNISNNNGRYGFLVESTSSSNLVTNNTADPNLLDFKDLSAGGGTSGTANTYSGNSCTTGSDPPGVCSSTSAGGGTSGAAAAAPAGGGSAKPPLLT